jgi:hypothetical protein
MEKASPGAACREKPAACRVVPGHSLAPPSTASSRLTSARLNGRGSSGSSSPSLSTTRTATLRKHGDIPSAAARISRAACAESRPASHPHATWCCCSSSLVQACGDGLVDSRQEGPHRSRFEDLADQLTNVYPGLDLVGVGQAPAVEQIRIGHRLAVGAHQQPLHHGRIRYHHEVVFEHEDIAVLLATACEISDRVGLVGLTPPAASPALQTGEFCGHHAGRHHCTSVARYQGRCQDIFGTAP